MGRYHVALSLRPVIPFFKHLHFLRLPLSTIYELGWYFGIVSNFHFSIRERKKEDFCLLVSAKFLFPPLSAAAVPPPSMGYDPTVQMRGNMVMFRPVVHPIIFFGASATVWMAGEERMKGRKRRGR